jgi:hypothetical protein
MRGQGLLYSASDGAPGRLERELAIVWPLLGRHITFHRRLVDLTDSVKAALLLSQTIYWTRHGRDIEVNAGWFYKTSGQWELETGLTSREQSTARQILCGQAILAEQRIGLPAKLHYRLSVDRLGELVAARIGRAFVRLDLADDAELAEILGPPHSFHRRLAAVGGGVHAGLLLSRAMYLTRLHARRPAAGWIAHPFEHWTAELGLTRREQEVARQDLQQVGVWEERLWGVPPHRYFRVRLDELLGLLRESGGDPRSVPEEADGNPDCGVATTSFGGFGESRMWQSHVVDSTKPPKQICGNRQNRYAETAKLNIGSSTQEGLLQPPFARADVVGGPCGGGDLVFPNGLLPEECARALMLVGRVPERVQPLLDELAGCMDAGAVQRSPLSYLRGLVKRAEAGDFDPELGLRVAEARRQREVEAALRQERQAEELRQATERANPEAQERIAERRQEIRRLFGAGRTRPSEGSRP